MKLKLNNIKLIPSDSIALNSATRTLIFIILITLISGCSKTKYSTTKLQDSQSISKSEAVYNSGSEEVAGYVGSKGLAANQVDSSKSDLLEIRKIRDILIAPIQSDGMTRNIVLSASQSDLIQQEFEQEFKLKSKLEVKTLAEILKLKNPNSTNSEPSVKYDSKAIARLAAQHGISSVLFISVNKFQERSGASFGSNELASLGLSAQISDLNLKTLWSSAYDYSDSIKPLISFDDGKLAKLGFKSVDDLVKEAAKHVVDDFVVTRQKAFAKQ